MRWEGEKNLKRVQIINEVIIGKKMVVEERSIGSVGSDNLKVMHYINWASWERGDLQMRWIKRIIMSLTIDGLRSFGFFKPYWIKQTIKPKWGMRVLRVECIGWNVNDGITMVEKFYAWMK